MTDQELEAKLVDVTEKFDACFAKKGKTNWKTAHGIQQPDVYYCAQNGGYYQYWPAFCAADARLPRWQCVGYDFVSVAKSLA